MKKLIIIDSNDLEQKKSFFTWSHLQNLLSKQHEELLLINSKSNTYEILKDSIKEFAINHRCVEFESLWDGFSGLKKEFYVFGIAPPEVKSSDDCSFTLIIESHKTNFKETNFENYNKVYTDFLLDEVSSFHHSSSIEEEKVFHIDIPDIDLSEFCFHKELSITFFYHSSEFSDLEIKNKVNLIEIISRIEGSNVELVDLDLNLNEFNDFSWKKLFECSSKIVSITGNPLSYAFLLHYSKKQKIHFQNWAEIKISPLRFIDPDSIFTNSYLNRIQLPQSIRAQVTLLLEAKPLVEKSVDETLQMDSSTLMEINSITAETSKEFRKDFVENLTEKNLSFFQQVVLSKLNLFSNRGFLPLECKSKIVDILIKDLHNIEGADLLFQIIGDEIISDEDFLHKVSERLISLIEDREHNSNLSFTRITLNFFNPVFCNKISDEKFVTKHIRLIELFIDLLTLDFEKNHNISSLRWLFFCNTITNNKEKILSLVSNIKDQEIEDYRILFIYLSYISTILGFDECYQIYEDVVLKMKKNEKNIAFLYNEILRSITYYLNNKQDIFKTIINQVYDIDPNILIKKYDNEWVNIEYILSKILDVKEDKSYVDFLQEKSSSSIYSSISSKCIDDLKFNWHQIEFPKFFIPDSYS